MVAMPLQPHRSGVNIPKMRAFLFDLDGTLVDTERENADSIERVLTARGRPLSAEEREFVIGHGWREIYQHLVTHGGIDLSFAELKELSAEEKERIVDQAGGLRVLPGAVEFVRRAARFGPCTVVSGSSRREIAFCIDRLGLGDVIPWFVGAEDVAHGKPSPDGYLLAARRLREQHGHTTPADCVVFEDSAAGVAAARAAGMYCVALEAGNFSRQDQSQAQLRVANFLEIGDRFFQAFERHP
jgi:beta-phosphoglucomutase-like phosphatase (HAD superfamily)